MKSAIESSCVAANGLAHILISAWEKEREVIQALDTAESNAGYLLSRARLRVLESLIEKWRKLNRDLEEGAREWTVLLIGENRPLEARAAAEVVDELRTMSTRADIERRYKALELQLAAIEKGKGEA